jgi:hypothetical protein
MFLMNIYLKHASYELVMSDMIFSLRKSKQNREKTVGENGKNRSQPKKHSRPPNPQLTQLGKW